MAGYHGYSMSNNAVDAYESGEKPKSKWTKEEILDEVESLIRHGLQVEFDFNLLKKLTLNKLRSVCLTQSSWHHTSSYYNETDFYSIDESSLENLTNEDIQELLDEKPEPKKVRDKTRRKAEVSYSVWGGTRAHPKKYDYNEVCEIDDTWAYTSNGKKRLDGKYVTYKLIYDNQKGDVPHFYDVYAWGRYVNSKPKEDLVNDLINLGAFKDSDYETLMKFNIKGINWLHHMYIFGRK